MKLLVFCVGKHVKGIEKAEDMKKFFVYQLERLGREEGLAQFSIVFDCRNAGLKNMDMEFTQFMINVMKDYYPDPLNYIIVFEMPWVLNAAFKIIKVKVQFHPDFKGGHQNVFPSGNFLCVCKI